MQFDYIRLLSVLILALIATFGRSDSDPRNADFDFDAKLNCKVKGSAKEEENPKYCWAFIYYKNMTYYPNTTDPKCCETAVTNDDIPKDSELKEFVNIQSDGIFSHILYGKYLENAANDNHSGLLIPMLTVVNNKLVFSVKFSDNKCVNYTEKDGGGETHITNENRVAGNMIHFSYTDTADKQKIAKSVGARWEQRNNAFKRSYMIECDLCDEYLYLPIKANGTTYEFHIYQNRTARYDLDYVGSYYAPFYTEDIFPHLKSVQRLYHLCPVELRKWEATFKFGGNFTNGFYLPFRLLYPAFSTYLFPIKSNGKIVMIKEEKGCDYELIFNRANYKLLVPQTGNNTTRRRGLSTTKLGGEEHSTISGL